MTNANEVLQLSMEKIISEIEQAMMDKAELGHMSISLEEYPDNIRSCEALSKELEDAGFSVKFQHDLISEVSWANPLKAKSDVYAPVSSSYSSSSDIVDSEIPTISSDYEAS